MQQHVDGIPSSEIDALNGMRHREALIDGHHVADAISRVQHDACCATRREPTTQHNTTHAKCQRSDVGRLASLSLSVSVWNVQAQHGLHRQEQGRRVEGLEEDLGGLLAVAARVQRRLGQQHRMLLGSHGERRVRAAPQALHVVPIAHAAVRHGVRDLEQATELVGAVAHDHDLVVARERLADLGAQAVEALLLESAEHHARVLGPTDATHRHAPPRQSTATLAHDGACIGARTMPGSRAWVPSRQRYRPSALRSPDIASRHQLLLSYMSVRESARGRTLSMTTGWLVIRDSMAPAAAAAAGVVGVGGARGRSRRGRRDPSTSITTRSSQPSSSNHHHHHHRTIIITNITSLACLESTMFF